MLFMIGLGNPGSQYANNRHNVGFMLLEEVARHYGFPAFHTAKAQAEVSTGTLAEQKTHLIKPTTYMNLSARAIIPFMQFFKPERKQLLVIHDDLDLPLGKVRFKFGGGHGGHNGLRSLDESIGKDYWRLRIGIGHPGTKERVTGHVLSNFTSEEHTLLTPLLQKLAERITLLVLGEQFSDQQFAKVSTNS